MSALVPRFPLPSAQVLLTWEACKFPERRPDEHVGFERGCPACLIALRAAVTVQPPAGEFDGWWRSRDEIAPMVEAFERAVQA